MERDSGLWNRQPAGSGPLSQPCRRTELNDRPSACRRRRLLKCGDLPAASVKLAQASRSQHFVGQLGRGEPVRAQHERPARLPGSGDDGRIYAAQGPLAGRLVRLRVVGDVHAGIVPVPEHVCVRLQRISAR
jgi:hypothetical protein